MAVDDDGTWGSVMFIPKGAAHMQHFVFPAVIAPVSFSMRDLSHPPAHAAALHSAGPVNCGARRLAACTEAQAIFRSCQFDSLSAFPMWHELSRKSDCSG